MDSGAHPGLDHIVVLMFENRSFDNVLGMLYGPGEVGAFQGVLGRDLSNPIPDFAHDADQQRVPVHPAELLDMPDPDPGEEHPHTNTQLYGTVDPEENRFRKPEEMQPPFNAPRDPSREPSMDGFVADYIASFRVERGRLPRYREYAQIMSCHTPTQLPVLTTLAREFACFDRWFCEVPSQTFPNRSFFHAASSSGFVVNSPLANFPLYNDRETVLERLEDAGLSWKVYFDPLQLVSLTGVLHAPRLERYFPTHFVAMEEFFLDAAQGTLPAYSFIEPSLIPPHTDMHPPMAARARHYLFFLPRPSSMQGGDAFLARVYHAIRDSRSPSGSNFANTLLLVTFDEHGGTFDHVPPPRVPPPDPSEGPGQLGFRFDRSGVRVPALAISAWVDRRTVVSEEYRSTSVIRTLRDRWGLGPALTRRDASARDIAPVLARERPRPAEDWPVVPQRRLPRRAGLMELLPALPELGCHLFGAAMAFEGHRKGDKRNVDFRKMPHWMARQQMRRLEKVSFPRARKGAKAR